MTIVRAGRRCKIFDRNLQGFRTILFCRTFQFPDLLVEIVVEIAFHNARVRLP